MGGVSDKNNVAVEFEDYLPAMAGKLGGEGLIRELCNGFELLMDRERGVITLESLRRNSALLGLQGLTDDELACMLREGDVDGDGSLSQIEFCVLMFRLSPGLMDESRACFERALDQAVSAPAACCSSRGRIPAWAMSASSGESTSSWSQPIGIISRLEWRGAS